jgi:predicted RNase H-like nuclease (RuvC/YqgF family)
LKALRKTYNEQHELDQIRLQSVLEGKLSEIDELKKENEVINDQLEQMRKESDELKKKLDGYEKVNNLTGNINMDTSARDNEIMQLEAKLVSVFFLKR